MFWYKVYAILSQEYLSLSFLTMLVISAAETFLLRLAEAKRVAVKKR